MKRYLKFVFSVGLTFCLMLSLCFTSFADLKSLMIATDSNALMTMNLTDDDYGISLMSSIASITNTVDWSPQRTVFRVQLINTSTGGYINEYKYPTSCSLEEGLRFKYTAPTGYNVYRLYVYNVILGDYSDSPRPGTYDWSIDISSALSHSYSTFGVVSAYQSDNVAEIEGAYTIPSDYYIVNSGDAYISNLNITIGSGLERFGFRMGFAGVRPNQLDLAIKESFIYAQPGDDNITTIKPDTSADQDLENYQNDISSSLSDLSSSVDDVNEGISGITEAIENLQGAMEPHYSNVLTQLHHITEQLHAFYDQVYNNIHLPELDMLTQIRTAIENIDLQIEVDISEVKTAINNMSTAVQNKLQTTTDQITNGYDNSGIVQENAKLEQSINDYDEVESEIFDEAGGFVGEFEYPSVESLSGGVIKALAFVGSFLQSIFLSMGDFSSIITFSLTMIFVMVVVGYHRIRS